MIPKERKLNWVYEDFPEDSDSDEDTSRYISRDWKRRTKRAISDRQEYNWLTEKGLTHVQAYVAAYSKMPPKRKQPKGIGAQARANKIAKTATSKSTKSKSDYGGSKIDWASAVKAATLAAKKEVDKTIETQYSTAMCTLTHIPELPQVDFGWNLTWLNYVGTRVDDDKSKHVIFGWDQALVFNLGYLSQQGSSLASGYRIGQRINAKYLRMTIAANLPYVTADCTYHWRIVRRKNDQTGQQAYKVPSLTSLKTLGLFKPLTDGPYAKESSFGVGGSSEAPFPYHASAMRQNTEAWTFCTGGHGYKTVRAMTSNDPTIASPEVHCQGFNETLYLPLDQEWEFVTRTGSDIKGGNYFFVLWREGAHEGMQMNVSIENLNAAGGLQLKVMSELAYKDG